MSELECTVVATFGWKLGDADRKPVQFCSASKSTILMGQSDTNEPHSDNRFGTCDGSCGNPPQT